MSLRAPVRAIVLLVAAWLAAGCGSEPSDAAPVLAATSVSGALLPTVGIATDSDVNDPGAPFESNDSFEQAQRVGNATAVGGFVSAATDRYDYYRVELLAGQHVVLHIADDHADLDLYLFDAAEILADAALDPAARTQVLAVPTAGTYFIVVRAHAAASNYLITLDAGDRYLPSGWSLSDPFVVGEAIVRFRPATNEKSLGLLRAHTRYAGWDRERESVERNLRVSLDALPTSYRVPAHPIGWRLADDTQRIKLETLLTLKTVYHDEEVADASPNYLYTLSEVSDPYHPYQWSSAQIGATRAWPITTGTAVVVAVLDTGVLRAHPDLQGQLLDGHDFVQGIRGGEDSGNTPRPKYGNTFHGTHVAGTIAALTDNGIGISGIAHGARILPVRVCDANCSAYALEQGLRFAAGMPNDARRTPARPARVINLSFGREGGASSREQALFTHLAGLGITVVAAAGNENESKRHYPAAYNHVLAVGAIDFMRVRAPYSNFGSWIDLVAPGGDMARDRNEDGYPDGVLSTSGDDRNGEVQMTYRYMHGTSMAAPHVTAVVAMMKSVAPMLVAADVADLLHAGALTDDIGAPGRDAVYGSGLINAYKAVTAARDFAGAAAAPDPQPAAATLATPTSETTHADIGRLYVLLVDPSTFETRRRTVAVLGADGRYTYRFDAVSPGTYLVVAGADHDGDGSICATGEPCGAAGGFSVPQLVEVPNRDQQGQNVQIKHRVLPRPGGTGFDDRTFIR